MKEEDMTQYQNDDSIEQDVDDEADSLDQCGEGGRHPSNPHALKNLHHIQNTSLAAAI